MRIEYIAGLVDSEGCIGIIKRPSKHALDPYLHINICHEDVLKQVQNTLGTGRLYKESRQSKGGLDCYMYSCNSRSDLLKVLPLLLPHLIVKKQLAEIVYEYCLNHVVGSSNTDEEYLLWIAQNELQHKHNHSTKISSG